MIKILIIDDTALVRQHLRKILQSSFDNIEVFLASDSNSALDKINIYKPDIITFNYEMPNLNGTETIKKIIEITSAPIIMLSSYTSKGAKVTMEALNIGVFDFLCKPDPNSDDSQTEFEELFSSEIECAIKYVNKKLSKESNDNNLNISKPEPKTENEGPKKSCIETKWSAKAHNYEFAKIDIVGIGISTGGPPVISKILKSLPEKFDKSILIVQHMPSGFTAEFAKRLNETSNIRVKEAENNEVIKPGFAYVAPGGMQMSVQKRVNDTIIIISDGEKVSGHKPSADILFDSMADHLKGRCIGIIMTGMGHDGSDGLLKLRNTGSITWGQTKETCVVYGMPKAAKEKDAVLEELSVDEIIKRLSCI